MLQKDIMFRIGNVANAIAMLGEMVETSLGLAPIVRIVIDLAHAPFDTPDGTIYSPTKPLFRRDPTIQSRLIVYNVYGVAGPEIAFRLSEFDHGSTTKFDVAQLQT